MLTPTYHPDPQRYDGRMSYRRCGRSGLSLPAISLGLWHNFGDQTPLAQQQQIAFKAFDLGVTHFDLANNYGPPYGAAEKNFGQIVRHLPRDELIISSKAGYDMWPGPYGEWGSRKHLLASLDQSLRRLGLDYVDIFYSHRFDPNTPIDETLSAIESAIQAGKALYAGISSYPSNATHEAIQISADRGWNRLIIHQPNYSMLNRWIERRLVSICHDAGIGLIAFCPLYQGLLTDKYLETIPSGSRHAVAPHLLRESELRPDVLQGIHKLNEIARGRGQSLAQMAIAWILRDPRITSVLCGASRIDQIVENCQAVHHVDFSVEELRLIDEVLAKFQLPPSHWATD